jgi:MFS family permease
MPPKPEVLKETTFLYERWRAGFAGVVETAGTTFLILIALRYFQTGWWEKALLASSVPMGLFASPAVVYLAARGGWHAGKTAAILCVLGGIGFLGAAASPVLEWFLAGTILGMACSAAIVPLMTQITADNYPSTQRGRLFARTVTIRIMSAAVFADLAGRLLSGRLDRFPWVLGAFGLAMLAAAWCIWQVPARRVAAASGVSPLEGFRVCREDARFRAILSAWALMGFANLMMLSVRVEYLGNPKYGFIMSTASIAIITGVVPNVARLLMNPFWGHLFDRVDFFALRTVINLTFALAILLSFASHHLVVVIAGAALFGVAAAGGEIAWSLWVTKFAQPDRVADYMAVHTFLTGVRGMMAPFISFAALLYTTPFVLAWVSAGLIFFSCILLQREKGRDEDRRAQPLTEEIIE